MFTQYQQQFNQIEDNNNYISDSSSEDEKAHSDIPCKYFFTEGCRYGTNCQFSHDPNFFTTHPNRENFNLEDYKKKVNLNNNYEQKNNSPKHFKAPCKYFLYLGNCKFGVNCKFSHIKINTTPIQIFDNPLLSQTFFNNIQKNQMLYQNQLNNNFNYPQQNFYPYNNNNFYYPQQNEIQEVEEQQEVIVEEKQEVIVEERQQVLVEEKIVQEVEQEQVENEKEKKKIEEQKNEEVRKEETEESEKEGKEKIKKESKKKTIKKKLTKKSPFNEEEWKKAETICSNYEKALKELYKIESISPCFVEKKVQIQIGISDSINIEKIPKVLDEFKVLITLINKEVPWSEIEESSSDDSKN